MRVCVVDLNGPFGPLRSFAQLVEPLRTLDVGCEFVVTEPSVELLRTVGSERAIHVIEGGHSVRRDIAIGRRIRALRSVGIDLVHANTTSGARGAILGSVGRQRPMLVHLRNSRLSAGERLLLTLLVVRPRTGFVAVSNGALSEAAAPVRARASVIADPASTVATRGVRGPGNPPRIGVVANQQPTKGLDVFVGAAERLASVKPTWEVFGSAGIEPPANPYVAECRARLEHADISDSVMLHGVVPSMEHRYRDLDVMLVTSRRESFSRVCVEAMLAGTPLVAPAIPGLRETVGGDGHATMYTAGDGDAAAAAVSAVLADYGSALEKAAAARRHAEAAFAPGRIAERLATIYRKVSGTSR